jgi:membrane-bound serine protease (ClpP class)
MRRLALSFLFLLVAWPLLLPAAKDSRPAILLDIDGAIGPATSDYIHRGLEKAKNKNAALIILRMDTPGGLDVAMRKMIQDIIASPVPVVTYVSPSGARAASAGTYILYASHVAAMAPGTNLGAATPVQIGGDSPAPDQSPDKTKKDKKGKTDKPELSGDAMRHKQVNDAIAYIRSLAQMRGRNIEWAEKAVREAASLPADEAVKQNVVDLTAKNLDDLVTKLNGRKVNVLGQNITLDTKEIKIERIEPDWRSRLLAVITDPNVAYILMLLGVYGLFFELWNPGYVLPGVIGGISLLLALYAFQVLPVNYAGFGLIILGMAFMVAEAFMPSFGILGFGGVLAFVAGSVILLDTDAEGFGISWSLIATVTLVSAAFFLTVVSLALRARRRPVVSGKEELIGRTAEATTSFKNEGRVRVRGEDWQARTQRPVQRGQRVRIIDIEGLTLIIEPETETQMEKN